MRRVLQAKHWQIFVALVIPSFFQGSGESVYFNLFFYFLSVTFYVGWILLLGTWLHRLSSAHGMSYPLFVAVAVLLIVVLFTHQIFLVLDVLPFNVFNIVPTPVLMLCYILASLIVMTRFIGKNLKMIELGEEVDINDYVNDILSLIFWPIGIWMFQPRINSLYRRLSGDASNTFVDPVTAFKKNNDAKRTFTLGTINRMIGYGILIFVIGVFAGLNWIKYVQLLMPVGSFMTFFGVFYFLKETDLQEEFRMDRKDDVLTYFWNVLVLKLWTLMFVIWMIVMDLTLITGGWL